MDEDTVEAMNAENAEPLEPPDLAWPLIPLRPFTRGEVLTFWHDLIEGAPSAFAGALRARFTPKYPAIDISNWSPAYEEFADQTTAKAELALYAEAVANWLFTWSGTLLLPTPAFDAAALWNLAVNTNSYAYGLDASLPLREKCDVRQPEALGGRIVPKRHVHLARFLYQMGRALTDPASELESETPSAPDNVVRLHQPDPNAKRN